MIVLYILKVVRMNQISSGGGGVHQLFIIIVVVVVVINLLLLLLFISNIDPMFRPACLWTCPVRTARLS